MFLSTLSLKLLDIPILIFFCRLCFFFNFRTTHQKSIKAKGIHLKSIAVYPIKSCGAFLVTSRWPLTSKGLKYDREWMIIDENGVAMTQKKEPRMCLIKPNITDNQMTLSFPGMEDIAISLDDRLNGHIQQSTVCQSKVCRTSVIGVDCGVEIANWISLALNISNLRLIRQCDDDSRDITLSNQAQFLLVNKTSVEWLADKVVNYEEDIDRFVARFRGNLIIETENPLEEMKWKQLKIGNVTFAVDGPCSRCQMICIDQYSGDKTTEPLRTIAREFNGKMRFGIYLSQVRDTSSTMYINCVNHIQEFYE
jgi:molybdenum cofactor sulfurtransferase